MTTNKNKYTNSATYKRTIYTVYMYMYAKEYR